MFYISQIAADNKIKFKKKRYIHLHYMNGTCFFRVIVEIDAPEKNIVNRRKVI